MTKELWAHVCRSPAVCPPDDTGFSCGTVFKRLRATTVPRAFVRGAIACSRVVRCAQGRGPRNEMRIPLPCGWVVARHST